MQRLKYLRHITANYFCMQGLRMVPFGIVLIITAVSSPEWWPELANWAPLPHLVGIAIAFVLFKVIGGYYERTFGHVQSMSRSNYFWWGYGSALAAILLSFVIDAKLHPPVNVLGLTFAILILVYWGVMGSFQTHYIIMATLLAGISLLPLQGVAVNSAIILVVVGSIYIIGGLLDHLVLVRTLKPLPEEPHGPTL